MGGGGAMGTVQYSLVWYGIVDITSSLVEFSDISKMA